LKIIALTGAIGTGKSTVAKMFEELGVPVIDADKISHSLTGTNSDIIEMIISHFGNDYCDEKKNLNRAKLRQRIFESSEDKLWLEQLLHPKIYTKIREQIETIKTRSSKTPYIIIVIPLLFETGKPDFIDEVWNIDTQKNEQISRLLARDNMTKSSAEKIIAQQYSREKRLKMADKIILNNGDLTQLRTQILKIHSDLFIT
jgi:dephospho-CoA kinase